MKVMLTEEMLNKYQKDNDEVSGTNSYNKYYMMREMKINGKWKFCGWAFVNQTGYFRKIKNNIYIYMENFFGDQVRYKVEKEVLNLFSDELSCLVEN